MASTRVLPFVRGIDFSCNNFQVILNLIFLVLITYCFENIGRTISKGNCQYDRFTMVGNKQCKYRLDS